MVQMWEIGTDSPCLVQYCKVVPHGRLVAAPTMASLQTTISHPGGRGRQCGGGSFIKILCRFSIAINYVFRYNRKDTRQVCASGEKALFRRRFGDETKDETLMELIKSVLQQLGRMQWSDYLDIALVAFLIYKLIPLVKSPSTMRIAGAVVAMVVLSAVTGLLQLYTINFILNQVMSVGLLAVIILFQPELRRMLDHLGSSVRFRTLFGGSKPAAEMDNVISQTVAACEVMSRERVGALIVFARDVRLEEYFKTGSQIDGIVSEQLIRNIFFPKAALHDGAMIIRDGRVAAAGCVLPLSDSSHLSADLGTRHRAGVGMSEASDAVVVIVSEETGTISVAVDGMLKRHLAPQTLERLLYNELCADQEEEENKLRVRLKQRLQKLERKDSHEK